MHYHVRKRDWFPSDKITLETLSFERSTSKCLYGTKNLTIGERFEWSTALIAYETRCDVSVRGFCSAGHDIKVFTRSTNSYTNQILSKSYEVKEKEKKRAYNQKIQVVEHGMLTSVVLSATGDMGRGRAKTSTLNYLRWCLISDFNHTRLLLLRYERKYCFHWWRVLPCSLVEVANEFGQWTCSIYSKRCCYQWN